MRLDEFKVGLEFWCGDRQWRCTDVGTRIVVAIRIDEVAVTTKEDAVISSRRIGQSEAEAEGWFDGPPYASAELVFDEYDMEACSLVPDLDEAN